jgi:hypothetical protein
MPIDLEDIDFATLDNRVGAIHTELCAVREDDLPSHAKARLHTAIEAAWALMPVQQPQDTGPPVERSWTSRIGEALGGGATSLIPMTAAQREAAGN